MSEGVPVGHIIHHYYGVSSAIVGASNGAIPFLPGRVPYLQLTRLLLNLHSAETKVYTDGADVAIREGVVSKTEENTRFPNTCVSNQNELQW